MRNFIELPRDILTQVLQHSFSFFDELPATYQDVQELIDQAVIVIDANINARCREESCDISLADFTAALNTQSLDFVSREFLYLITGILSFGIPQEKYVKHCSIRVIFLTNSSREWLQNQLIYRGIAPESAAKIAEWTIRADCVYSVQSENDAPKWLKDGGFTVIQAIKKFICQELDAAGTPVVCQLSS